MCNHTVQRKAIFLTITGMPHNNVLVNKGLHIRQWCMTQPTAEVCRLYPLETYVSTLSDVQRDHKFTYQCISHMETRC